MKNDPAALLLISMAEKDFVTVDKMSRDNGFPEEAFGFHAQQAIEKAAKAMLAVSGVKYGRVHDLEPLIDALVEKGAIKAGEFDDLLDLTDFAVQYRYEAFEQIGDGLDRPRIAGKIRRFLDIAAGLVGKA